MNEMLVAITRHTARPFHNELKATLFKQPEWQNARADLTMWFHGPQPSQEEVNQYRLARERGQLKQIYNMSLDTNGNITQLLPWIFREAINEGYDYLMLLDDDARFVVNDESGPEEAVNTFIEGFDTDPLVGQVGPMGPLRKKWRYENNPDFLQRLRHNPWTTLGCQVYRVSALKTLMDFGMLDELTDMEFRADSFIAMALDIAGYGVYEMDVPFAHALHSGQRSLGKTREHHLEMLTRGQKDWAAYRRMFDKFAGTNHAFYTNELRKLINSHERHHNSKIDRLTR